LCQRLPGAGALRCHLLRTGLGKLQTSLGLRLALTGHAHSVAGRLLGVAGVGERGFGGVGRGYGCVKLLFADDVFLHQRLIALQVGLGLGRVSLGLGHAGMGGFQLLLGLLYGSLGTAQIRVSRGQIAAGVGSGDRHIHVGGRCVSLRAGQCCFGVLHATW